MGPLGSAGRVGIAGRVGRVGRVGRTIVPAVATAGAALNRPIIAANTLALVFWRDIGVESPSGEAAGAACLRSAIRTLGVHPAG
jgi:hypothetical protein